MSRELLRTAVVIASAGRPELLREVIGDVRGQTASGVTLVVSVPDEASLPSGGLPPEVIVVFGRGLSAQRNVGMDAVPDADVIVFFDDDAIPRGDYVERAVDFFRDHPHVVALTGRVLLDGAVGTAISREQAAIALESSHGDPVLGDWRRGRELYGCNFAIRASRSRGARFDPRLPLYSWLEDHDLARRMLRLGIIAVVDDCVAVHRGVKSGGRTAHLRLGYSQMMNPLHFMNKGTFPLWLALHETVFRLAKNATGSVRGPESGWRRRRLHGNLLALSDVARGRITPERILELPADEPAAKAQV